MISALLVTALLRSTSVAQERSPVLVYVANETAPQRDHQVDLERLLAWLESSDQQRDRDLAAAVRGDFLVFPEQVDREQTAITRASSTSVVATNRLLQARSVVVTVDGHSALVAFPTATADTAMARSNPASQRENLAALLEFVASRFDPATHDFLVVTHSHGDAEYALTPRVGLQTHGLTRTEFLERVHGESSQFIARYGIKTSELLELFADAHRKHAISISLLVLDSCDGTLQTLPPAGIETVLVAANGAPLQQDAIDFEKILNARSGSLRDAFVQELTRGPFEIVNEESLANRKRLVWFSTLKRASWFAPLALWCVVALWMWCRRSSRIA